MKSWQLAFVLALAVAAVGCVDRAVAAYPISPPLSTEGNEILSPGDVVEIIVNGEPDLSHAYQVADDGSISFPMIGDVKVVGRTKREIEADIQARLKDGYIKNPHVTVIFKEVKSRRVTVMGQVKEPGTFNFTSNMSVLEAIAMAGGFTPLAKKNAVRVTRVGQDKPFYVAVQDIAEGKAPNFYLRPGDSVFVAERLL